jgi:hypothetical protein
MQHSGTNQQTSWASFAWRVTATHMITYMAMGMLFSTVFQYADMYRTGHLAEFMKDFSSPWIAAGPSLQFIRGLLFALVLWPFRALIFDRPKGWLLLWGLMVGLAILGTAGPSPGSLEGFIYTQLSLREHLTGLPEVLIQTLAFSFILFRWENNPTKSMQIGAIVGVCLILLFSIGGVLAAKGLLPANP